jgi:hypothetical protein
MLIWQDPNIPELIEQVIGSGLFSFDDEPHFSWWGCKHCAVGLGSTVYDLQGYRSLADTELSEFQVCGDCFNSLYYGKGGKLKCERK